MFDVDAVSFDGDGTLWDHDRAMTEALQAAVGWFGARGLRHAGEEVTARWLADIRNGIAERTDATITMEEIRFTAFTEALTQCEVAEPDATEVFELYMGRRRDALRPFEEVIDFLTALAEKLPLALVTNGNTWPEQVGLQECFSVVVNAAELGVRKPDPRIFAHTCHELGVSAERCLHVGDAQFDDVTAARAVGMPAAWCNRTAARWEDGLGEEPVTVSRLDELSAYL